MSKASAVRAGEAYVELFADGTRLEAGLKRAQARLKAFGQSLRTAGATMALAGGAMLAPFVHAMKTFLEAAKDGKLAGAELGKAISMHQAVRTTTAAVEDLEVAIGAALTPTLLTAAAWLKSVVNGLAAWARANPGTVTGIALLAGGVAALGAGLLGLGAAVNIAAWSFGGLSLAATSALGAISVAVSAILSPVALLVAAVGGLGYVLATETDAGRQAVEYLGEGFSTLRDDALAAWGGIQDAMASGDLGGAMRIAWGFIKLEWASGVNWLMDSVQSVVASISKSFLNVGFAINYSFRYILTQVGNALDAIDAKTNNTMAQIALLGSRRINQKDLNVVRRAMGMPERTGPEATPEQTTQQRNADLEAFRQSWVDATNAIEDWNTESSRSRSEDTQRLADELQQLIDSVARNRTEVERTMREKGERASKAAAEVTARAPKADVFGTFSSAATFGIGIGSTAADRTAKATEASAKELKAIREKIFTGQEATFAP
jgi:hypothetical protein